MLSFTLITNADHRPVAVIGDHELRGHQFDPLYALLPEFSTSHFDLAQRWQVPFVLAPAAWADDQRKRVPMTRPKGHKLALLQ